MMTENGDRKKRPKREDTGGTDPDQSNDQSFIDRRVLRSEYLSIQSFIRARRDEIAAPGSKKFISLIDEVDAMHHLVNKPREQVLDAEAIRDLAATLVTSIKVHSTGSVTPSLFVSTLISEYGKKERTGITEESTQISWTDIGHHASPLFMTFQGSCTMLGPMKHDAKPPKVLVTRKRSRSVKEEKVKPEELDETVSKEKTETETEKTIATMFDIFKSKKNVCLENIILNRVSFAQTVENLFALSFLVKDGRVVIMVDEKGFHHVSPKNAPAAGMVSSGKVAYSHFIFKFDFKDWKLMKDLVAEGYELMPHRTKVNSCVCCESEPVKKENSYRSKITTQPISRIKNGSYELGSKWRPICV